MAARGGTAAPGQHSFMRIIWQIVVVRDAFNGSAWESGIDWVISGRARKTHADEMDESESCHNVGTFRSELRV